MTTQSINPHQLEKTLHFLEQYFPERLEFSFNYLQALLLREPSHLPALVIYTQESDYYPLEYHLPKWIKAVTDYLFDAPMPSKKKIDTGHQLHLLYLHDSTYKKLAAANIHNVIAFVNPNSPSIDDQEINEMEIIRIRKSLIVNVNMKEILSEIPEFIKFLKKREEEKK